jgi:hypothetical protein
MGEVVQLPRTIGSAERSLEGIDQLLTAKGWERSAIVYAFTYEGKPGPQIAREVVRSTIREFAGKRIGGLRTQDAVRHYRDAWKRAIEEYGAADVRPGQKVTLPDQPFPAFYPTNMNPAGRENLAQQAEADGVGISKVMNVAANPKAVASAITADPEFMEKVIEHMPRRARVNTALGIHDALQAEEVAARDAERGRPMPPRPMPDYGAAGAFVWRETVRKALPPLRKALTQYHLEHIHLNADDRELFEEILIQIDYAVAQLRMAADGTVSDKEIAEFLSQQ